MGEQLIQDKRSVSKKKLVYILAMKTFLVLMGTFVIVTSACGFIVIGAVIYEMFTNTESFFRGTRITPLVVIMLVIGLFVIFGCSVFMVLKGMQVVREARKNEWNNSTNRAKS